MKKLVSLHTEAMNPLTCQIDEMQRDRSVSHLQSLYAQGVMDEEELDRRLNLALEAGSPAELNRSLQGLVRMTPAVLARPRPGIPAPAENIAAGFVHLSAFLGSFLWPAIVKSVSKPGSRLWWEAGRALSLQLALGGIGIVAFILSGVLGALEIFGAACLLWLVATVLASVRAFNGQASTGWLGEFFPMKPRDPGR